MLTFQSLTESHRSKKHNKVLSPLWPLSCHSGSLMPAMLQTGCRRQRHQSGMGWQPTPWGLAEGKTGPVCHTTTRHGGQAGTAMTGLSQVSTSGWRDTAYLCWEITVRSSYCRQGVMAPRLTSDSL